MIKLGMEAAVAGEVDRGDIQNEFAELTLPMAAIELNGLLVVAITPSVFPDGPPFPGGVVGRSVLDIIDPADHARAKLSLEALADGAVDFVRSHGRLVGSNPDQVYTHWVAAVEIAGERVAVALIAAGASHGRSPLTKYFETIDFVVGTVTRDWVVSTVSSGVEGLLGIPAAEFTGRVLLGTVAQRDVDRVLRAAGRTNTGLSVGLSVEMRTADGGWRDIRTVLGSLANSSGRFFILAPQPAAQNLRALKLEEHLRRIAVEVQASGVLEVAGDAPALPNLAGRARLTPRQWEVLTRLVRGERIPTIAEELFVSESTVRNHLSAIYDRLGVHSQGELMALALGD